MSSIFSVVTLNLKNEIFTKSARNVNAFFHRKLRIAEFIEKHHPLCIGVQELTPHMREQFEPMLEHFIVIGENRYIKDNPFNEQTAIVLNKTDSILLQTKTIWLSNTPTTQSKFKTSLMPRTCTMAKIQIKDTHQKLRIFNVHLDFMLPMVRLAQVKILLQYIQECQSEENLPFLIVGDFNAGYHSRAITFLRNNLHEYDFAIHDVYSKLNPESIQATYHGFKDKTKPKHTPIDYIFVSDDFLIQNVSIITHTDSGLPLSDHYPIIATLQLP